jgi:RNA polymerase sigma factor (sigma-70 family)
LDAPAGEDDSVIVLLEDVLSPQPYEQLVREELNQTINTLLSMLSNRQQQVLRLHFGITDGMCHSLEEIGNRLGISKERARQIERQAMDKLKELGADLGLEDFLE